MNVDLAGTSEVGTSVSGVLFVSTLTTNIPQPSSGNVVDYDDPSAPTSGVVTPGVADGMPNSGEPLQPFLRGYPAITLTSFGITGNSAASFTYPADAQPGDLAVIFLFNILPNYPTPGGWTEVYRDATGTNRVWIHYLNADEPGQQINQLVQVSSSGAVLLGIWGNAQFGSVLTNSSLSGGTAFAPQITIPGGDVGVFAYCPMKGYNSNNILQVKWTSPSYFQHTSSPGVVGFYNQPFIGDYYPVHDSAIAPAIAGQAGVALTGTTNYAVHLKGLTVYPFATVSAEEAIGNGDTVPVAEWVHLMAEDVHSPQSAYGYAQGSMNDTGSGVTYTYERWIRIRFDPKFNTVSRFRFWVPNLDDIPDGWTVKYGTAPQFRMPVNTSSAIATTPVPTSDPGWEFPNIGGETRLAGTGTQYSDWIVLQASADTAVVGPGPVLGFSTEGTLIPLQFAFVWTET